LRSCPLLQAHTRRYFSATELKAVTATVSKSGTLISCWLCMCQDTHIQEGHERPYLLLSTWKLCAETSNQLFIWQLVRRLQRHAHSRIVALRGWWVVEVELCEAALSMCSAVSASSIVPRDQGRSALNVSKLTLRANLVSRRVSRCRPLISSAGG
jgi:hypothetical protein